MVKIRDHIPSSGAFFQRQLSAFSPKRFKLKPARFYQHESAESHKRSVA
jgi:hypothetical protein